MSERSQMTTPTTEVEQAVERLRRLHNNETYESVYGCRQTGGGMAAIDSSKVIDAYLRETDTTLVDEVFAKSVAVEVWSNTAGRHFDIQKGSESAVLLKARDKWLLIILSDIRERNCCVDNPTIGQFYKACDLFGVKLKRE